MSATKTVYTITLTVESAPKLWAKLIAKRLEGIATGYQINGPFVIEDKEKDQIHVR